MKHLIGLRQFRQNVAKYAREVEAGQSFVVMKHAKPIFKISPPAEDERWETGIDFTKIKRGGVDIDDLIARLP